MKFNFKASLLFAVLFVVGCATYTSLNKDMRRALYAGSPERALKKLESSSLKDSSTNYVLYRMEKGMLTYLSGQYEKAVPPWVEADKKIDALYTTSITKTAATFVLNDSFSDYSGESHERLLIPVFSSLAFFSVNNTENAAVMIRRANEIFNIIKDSDSKQKNAKFKYDAFTFFLAGVVFESRHEYDNALISYERAIRNSEKMFGKGPSSLSSSMIAHHILQLAKQRNRRDIISKYAIYSAKDPFSVAKNTGRFLVILENGNSPIKIARDFFLPVGRQLTRVSFPEYQNVPYSSRFATVSLDNKAIGRTVVLEDIGKIARQALEDRRVRDFARMSARLVAKHVFADQLGRQNQALGLLAQLYNLTTEVADTRTWSTLPDTIQVLPLSLSANKKHHIVIKPQYGPAVELHETVQSGEFKIYRLRTYF